MARWALILVALILGACPQPQKQQKQQQKTHTWPAWPGDEPAALALVQDHTARAPEATGVPVPETADALMALVDKHRFVAGWEAIVETLHQALGRSRRSVLLVGTFHDAAGQIDAFRRLVGPTGIRGIQKVAIELLAADGSWRGVPDDAQRGASHAVHSYLRSGKRESLDQVRRHLTQSVYTAWKYRYVNHVLDLVVTGRATGAGIEPCDMPQQLQRRGRMLSTSLQQRLRELHCLHALGALPARMAMLWGQAHLASDGLPRFFAPDTRLVTVHLFGSRPGPAGLAHRLKGRLLLADPLLLHLETRKASARYLLLLDGPAWGAKVERRRENNVRDLPRSQRHTLQLALEKPGRLVTDGKHHQVPAGTALVPLTPGHHSYLLTSAGRTLAGSLQMPRDGSIRLTVQPDRREVDLVIRHGRPGAR